MAKVRSKLRHLTPKLSDKSNFSSFQLVWSLQRIGYVYVDVRYRYVCEKQGTLRIHHPVLACIVASGERLRMELLLATNFLGGS